MPSATTKIRELLAAVDESVTIYQKVTLQQELVDELHRLAPAMCDVIDAARWHFDEELQCDASEKALREALAALDRAAEEGGEGGE